MQIKSQRLSRLRQKLIQLYHPSVEDLATFLAGDPLVKGTVYTLRRKCSKPSCRCARGELHSAVVLTASIKGKTQLWTIPEDQIADIRERTGFYRQFRQARSRFLKKYSKRLKEIMRIINEIERIRKQQP